MSDDELIERLEGALRRDPPPVDPARVSRVRDLARQSASRADPFPPPTREQGDDDGAGTDASIAPVVELRPRRSLLLAAAAGVVGAVAGGTAIGITKSGDNGPNLPLEAIQLEGMAGVNASASVVDHSWGMEMLLDVEGLPVGDTYDVIYVSRSGERVSAGGFVGAAVRMKCRNTSSLMRGDATGIEIVNSAGDVVISSTLS